jgi:hypothetical protein
MNLRTSCVIAIAVALGGCDGGGDGLPVDARGFDEIIPIVCDGVACAAGEYCDWAANDCGASGGPGTCTPRPFDCPVPSPPVCGCDGDTHDSECSANVDLTDVGGTGCDAPPFGFACGHLFCHREEEYCERQVSDVAGVPDDWACRALPASCDLGRSCACLNAEPCGADCTGDAADGLRLTCPGG